MGAGARLSRADPVFRYIAAARLLHQDLQKVLTQAAGYSLLVLTRGQRLAFLDSPVLAAADALSVVDDGLAALAVPEAAGHHHMHMAGAASALRHALQNLEACLRPRSDDAVRDKLVQALRAATDHLRAATRMLPGFEMVDLTLACCAAHGTLRMECQGEMVKD